MFLDDDIEFNDNAFKIMYKYLFTISPDIIGVGFNLINDEQYTKKYRSELKIVIFLINIKFTIQNLELLRVKVGTQKY